MSTAVDERVMNSRVVAVMVAYNRQDLLVQALDALGKQSRAVDAVLVVDNASADDSAAVAEAHSVTTKLLKLPRNTGGAGGFAAGIASALESLNAQYVWLMDDDTIPEPEALEVLLEACATYPGRVAVAGSRVLWTDGRDHPMNTPRRRPRSTTQEDAAAGSVQALPVRSSSFVSMLIEAEAIREVGLPVADYFIWNDDFEYSLRLLRNSVGLAVHSSKVLHLTKNFGATDADPGERFYYEVRNKIWLLKLSPGLSPLERVLYSGASVRRWLKTLIKSKNPSVLVRVGAKGFIHGLFKRPLPTHAVLYGLGELTEQIRKVDVPSLKRTNPTVGS